MVYERHHVSKSAPLPSIVKSLNGHARSPSATLVACTNPMEFGQWRHQGPLVVITVKPPYLTFTVKYGRLGTSRPNPSQMSLDVNVS